jgi:hypothetical protein
MKYSFKLQVTAIQVIDEKTKGQRTFLMPKIIQLVIDKDPAPKILSVLSLFVVSIRVSNRLFFC